MILEKLQLNPKIFDDDIEQVPIREGFGKGLLVAAEADSRIVGLCADLTGSTKMNFFREKFPERFVQIGVAEQNLATVASGMAAMGKIPFITSYAMFSPGRNWEQIRTTVCYNNRPVKIAGSHAGVSVGPDGGTHQAIEDIAIMRVIPRMVILSPCDAIEAEKATIVAAKTDTPVYIRLAREKTPVITTEETPFEIGKALVCWEAEDPQVVLYATGALVHKALLAVRALSEEGITAMVVNFGTIKPLDADTVIAVAKKAGAAITIEAHQIAGGFGSAIAECLALNYPIPIEFVGVKDQFGQSGTPEELIEHYGMGVEAIKDAVKKVIKRK